MLCQSQELSNSALRVTEKKTLNGLKKKKSIDCIKFPLTGKVTTSCMKVNVLLQALLGVLTIPDSGLAQEAAQLMKVAQRLSNCLVEFVVHCHEKDNLSLLKNAHLKIAPATRYFLVVNLLRVLESSDYY